MSSTVEEYQSNLFRVPRALNYLTSRGVGLDSIVHFGIGYYDYNEWDKFYDRIMFPIRDIQGNVLSFQARAIFDWKETKLPKYYHGSYDKSVTLYGLYENAKLITELDCAVLVEGPLDVVALYQTGIPAVTGLGTAFSEIQARLLRMYCSCVYIWFDNDPAGLKAVESTTSILRACDFEVHVVKSKSAKDPADVWLSKGRMGVLKDLWGS